MGEKHTYQVEFGGTGRGTSPILPILLDWPEPIHKGDIIFLDEGALKLANLHPIDRDNRYWLVTHVIRLTNPTSDLLIKDIPPVSGVLNVLIVAPTTRP
ncbi:MAG: hypothetical protein WCT16_01630 [Candidatus Buchananbacteria bacterium]